MAIVPDLALQAIRNLKKVILRLVDEVKKDLELRKTSGTSVGFHCVGGKSEDIKSGSGAFYGAFHWDLGRGPILMGGGGKGHVLLLPVADRKQRSGRNLISQSISSDEVKYGNRLMLSLTRERLGWGMAGCRLVSKVKSRELRIGSSCYVLQRRKGQRDLATPLRAVIDMN